jgi:hypothetical protein
MTEAHTDVRSTRWLWIAAIWCAGALFDASHESKVRLLLSRRFRKRLQDRMGAMPGRD